MLGTWGVKDSAGNWLEFRVSERRARETYHRNPAAHQLLSAVDPADLSKATVEEERSALAA